MSDIKQTKQVDSKCFSLKLLFAEKYTVDYYQRQYVWEKKQLDDLINDLSNAFLKCWRPEHKPSNVRSYDPYFMGEIVLSAKANEKSAIIDGQQRITTFTLLLIYLLQKYKNVGSFPTSDIEKAIYSYDYGELSFNLDIEERKLCMESLFKNGDYTPNINDKFFVQKIVDRFNDIEDCWNEKIDESNIDSFAYWLMEKVIFSKVWSNSDDFAYVIFETMNDRGLSLTQVEMLRSFLLANIDEKNRDESLKKFDNIVSKLSAIKLSSKSKAESEFFRVYLRSHYANDLSKNKDNSDFVKIGNAFHRWVRENEKTLALNNSSDYIDFINRLEYFSEKYELIYSYINKRDSDNHFYLVVNNDYGFTLQAALIIGAINYKDTEEIVEAKIQLISKYLTKVLTWKIWNHYLISQSTMEAPIYTLCKSIRDKSLEDIKSLLEAEPIEIPELNNSPTLNHQNRPKIKVLLSLITEIVAMNSGESDYILNKDDIQVEHIWSDHFEEHTDEFDNKSDFDITRNNIGDLLVLPQSFNGSYNDDPYEKKVVQYYSQNILAQTLCKEKYVNNPGFMKFKSFSGLDFIPYDHFLKSSIAERAELYKCILLWNWDKLDDYISIKKEADNMSTEKAKSEIEQNEDYDEEYHLNCATDEIKDLYIILKSSVDIFNLTICSSKTYVAFKKMKRNIICIKFFNNYIDCYINASIGELDDVKSLCRDVSKVGHNGSGDYLLRIRDKKEIEYLVEMIKQIY